MRIPLVDLKAQYDTIKDEISAALQRVFENSSFILGPEVAAFEEEFAAYIGTSEAIGVASGTAALHLALKACGIGAGDEVITSGHTFIATAEAISNAGARPVFVDINPRTYNIDPVLVERAISPQTRAIVPVHLYGQPSDLDPLVELASRHDLWLIEDAAQAHGAEYKGRRCGTIGDLGCFSFYPGKNLGAYGDAGAVTGNDPDLVERVRRLRDHGRSSKYRHDQLGYGERLDGIQAAVLRVKLQHLEEWTAARIRIAERYDELFRELPVTTPFRAPGVRHVYHLYVIRHRDRDGLLANLQAAGVQAGIHYPIPVHQQPAYVAMGYGDVVLPEVEKAATEILSLPLFAEMTDEQTSYVAGEVREFCERGSAMQRQRVAAQLG